MNYVQVLIEYGSLALNEPFLYKCTEDVQPFMRVKVPFRNRTCVGFVMSVQEEQPDVNYEIQEVLEVMDEAPLFHEELQQLAAFLSRRAVAPLISVCKAMLPKTWKPSSSHTERVMEEWLVKTGDAEQKPTRKQEEFLASLTFPVKASEARKQSASMTRSLLDKGILKIEKKPKQLLLADKKEQQPWPKLQPQQKQALSLMEQNDGRPILLYGVTGSGKTEVFFHMAQKALDVGKQVLFLVPEIGLTPMMIERVVSRFDVPVYIYHSRLSATEAASQYEQ
ncbi:MAG: DEAD/DEAH box helicase family protein, partial [Erysipelotrichaceae bacterium]|nr:DEAD/DEAH box helicase family protein [Erysipelotrichaceae bacterium]